MPDGVTVAQLILVQFVEVRILVGQPIYYSQSQKLFSVLYFSVAVLFSSFTKEGFYARMLFMRKYGYHCARQFSSVSPLLSYLWAVYGTREIL